jgi:hypothetical protein
MRRRCAGTVDGSIAMSETARIAYLPSRAGLNGLRRRSVTAALSGGRRRALGVVGGFEGRRRRRRFHGTIGAFVLASESEQS